MACYLAAAPGTAVAELLDEVEDEPGRGDDEEDDEGHRDEHQRAAVDGLSGTALTHQHRDQDRQVPVQLGQDLFTKRLCDHHRHRVAGSCRPDWRQTGHNTWQEAEQLFASCQVIEL